MSEIRTDPLFLGQRVVALLETGLRTATYKLATLMALIDCAIEHAPSDPNSELQVAIPDLAAHVLELYWPQVLPFCGKELRQSTQPRARIPQAVLNLRSATSAGTGGASLAVASARAPDAYARAIAEIGLCLAQQPLHRLQRLPGAVESECILYDDSFLHDHVSRKALRERGDCIVLFPGVATALARLAGLLKPALEIMWVDDVRRMNRFVDEDVPDVASHLFGRERIGLGSVRGPLHDAFGAKCFYCAASLGPGSPIDHVLPWSMVGIDGLANLVPACARCNRSKWYSLPTLGIVDRVLARDRSVLEQIAADTHWPTQYDRVVAVARGIYRSQPAGSPLWAGIGTADRLAVAGDHWWLSAATSPGTP